MQAAAERALEASRRLNESVDGESETASEDEDDMDEDDDDDNNELKESGDLQDAEMPEAGGSSSGPADGEGAAVETQQQPLLLGPPRIMITTSPSPCKDTYAFCEDLKNIFPGGEFFKRPKGRGFELGRIARWAAKRQYHSVMVVNEDHKIPST